MNPDPEEPLRTKDAKIEYEIKRGEVEIFFTLVHWPTTEGSPVIFQTLDYISVV